MPGSIGPIRACILDLMIKKQLPLYDHGSYHYMQLLQLGLLLLLSHHKPIGELL